MDAKSCRWLVCFSQYDEDQSKCHVFALTDRTAVRDMLHLQLIAHIQRSPSTNPVAFSQPLRGIKSRVNVFPQYAPLWMHRLATALRRV